MSGTREGGLQAARTNKERYGLDFYKEIGEMGGRISRGGGFAANHELAIEAGRKGGKASRRTSTGSHECPECLRMYKTKQSLATHMSSQHKPKSIFDKIGILIGGKK